MLTFYAHLSGGGSYPSVCREIAPRLAEWFGDAASFVDLRDPEALTRDASRRVDRSDVALVFGFPEWVEVIPQHQTVVGYHVCDLDVIPPHWVRVMNECEQLVVTPSAWCAEVFAGCGVTTEIRVVRHGIDPHYFCVGIEPDGVRYKLLHFCTSVIPDRKGTLELVSAFERVAGHATRPLLEIHTSSPLVSRRVERSPARESIHVLSERFLPASGMAQRLRSAHLVVQPSRAEGFGLVPLEALACGIPVVATGATGHAEYLACGAPGAVVVQTGALSACAPGPGHAPELSVDAIESALMTALDGWSRLRGEARPAASETGQVWAWQLVLAPLRALLQRFL